MRKIKIKICGIKNLAILNYCNKLNVDFFGLIYYNKSPRNIEINQSINLIKFHKKTVPVGVFVDHDFEDLNKIIKTTNLNYLQLHGNESNDYICRLKDKNNIKIIKAIGIENENDIHQLKLYSHADFILFDYKSKINDLPGGNAKSFNWSILKDKNIEKILS